MLSYRNKSKTVRKAVQPQEAMTSSTKVQCLQQSHDVSEELIVRDQLEQDES